MSNPSVRDLAYNPLHKPEDKKEQWDVYNKMWEEQVEGKGLKMFCDWAGAPLKAAIVGDPFSIFGPDPDSAELKALIADNTDEEFKAAWKRRAGKHFRDCDPVLYEKIVNEIAARDEAYEQAGITIIRNKLGWYPDEIENFNKSWGGSKFLSIYGGGYWIVLRNLWTRAKSPGVYGQEAAASAAVAGIVKEDPDARLYPAPSKEPNPMAPSGGVFGFDQADYRLFPNKQLVWHFATADKANIAHDIDPHLVSGGVPMGKDMYGRVFDDYGFKQEVVWFDSRLTYHHDCLHMNLVEGMCGLPDVEGWGYLTDTPKAIDGWKILPIPLEDQQRGAMNGVTTGTGQYFIDDSCTKSMKILEENGIEPIPVPYQNTWDTFHSGIDCSDSSIWRAYD
ncbi:hypothetical protein [Paraferrimonas sedimenticola]|uniref:Uncharacterized protein n=1 Tax=Paraferrimonas sedimenticola TaxID=375674 RepID=A0AA37RX77_9GAMM|nr:hypothetical protein [Paraferrimonas sedimenticola]GLP96352.1 hypothetical protein GCM10007895_16580 [Paraferrimonas sedimenticola]